ncbi:MAG: GNAT family N-acetyltransferase [Arcobacteraceae bacterium]
MNFYTIDSIKHPYFKEAWHLYESAFPKNEKRTLYEQEQTLQKKEYSFLALYEQKSFIGILGFWNIQEYIFIEHFAINPNLRGQNYGSKILTDFLHPLENIFLEIEPPLCLTTQRRLNFYENLGFIQNNIKHFQVPFRKNGSLLPLTLLSFQTPILPNDYERLYFAMKKSLPIF